MQEIAEFENADAGNDLIKQNINPLLYRAYFASKRNDNDIIDFNWCLDIKRRDVENVVSNCKLYGITEFTISDSSNNLMEILALFEKHGYHIKGMTNVKMTGISVPAIWLEFRI